MRYVDEFPHDIETHAHVWIEMPDGTRLAAALWLPADAHATPVPAILEYIPYRKRDCTAHRDSLNHAYFAGHGYACVRVDLRGSGDSEGVLEDEYLEQELADGEAVLDWIAAQSWCTGAVGMIGISWGGFNGLQLAARQPEPLKAVITVCSTDDRYADDVHYMGGCLLGDNLSWAAVMFAFNACPPDPALVGERWRELWMQRLDGSGHWLEQWLAHQHRDGYWAHGSICEDFSRVKVPVLAVSGWADGYSNAVFRLMEKLEGPRLGLVGPWSHKYPHQGKPGPAIGFLQECLRFWDHWLRGGDTGIMAEPRLRVYLQGAAPPFTRYEDRAGRWVGEEAWPSPRVSYRRYALSPGYALLPTREAAVASQLGERTLPVQSPLSVGLFAGKWCSYAYAPDLPGDQREEDGGSLVFESTPLETDLDVLGAPVLELELTSSAPVAMVCARLSDVAQSREATRVTYGVLNLTHRASHARPEPLTPGEPVRIRLELNHVGHTFERGHRFRVAISTSYFPLAWAAPEAVRLDIATGRSTLELPVRRRDDSDEPPAPTFEPPEAARPVGVDEHVGERHSWRVIRDLEFDESTLEVVNDHGTFHFPEIDWTMTRRATEWYTFRACDFQSLRGEVQTYRAFARGDWEVSISTRTRLTCDREHFVLTAELDAYEGNTRVFARSWNRRIPRDLV